MSDPINLSCKLIGKGALLLDICACLSNSLGNNGDDGLANLPIAGIIFVSLV